MQTDPPETSPKQTENLKVYEQKVQIFVQELLKSENVNPILTIQTLHQILSDLVKHPNDSKYKKISLSNKEFQSRIVEAGMICLRLLEELVGYERRENFIEIPIVQVDQLKILVAELEKYVSKPQSSNEKKQEIDSKVNEQSPTVEIDGKVYQRPILKSVSIPNETVFEVSKQYDIKEVLGHGGYGIVVRAYDNVRKKDVAIKKIINPFEYHDKCHFMQERMLREILIMLHFRNHPNIVDIIDLIPPRSYQEFKDIYIVMDCLDKNLRDLVNTREPLRDQDVQYFLYQILCGVYYLHSADVLHRDIKPENILLNKEMDVKICDFGISRGIDAEDPHMSTLYVVTRWYRAPELCMSYPKSFKPVDIWSVGCLFGELLQKPRRRPLFPGDKTLRQLQLILKVCGSQKEEDIKAHPKAKQFVLKCTGIPKVDFTKWPKFAHVENPHALDLLEKMLQFNPAKRITAEQALRHPYLEQMFDEDDLAPCPKFVYKYENVNFKERLAEDKDFVRKIIYDVIMDFNKAENGIAGDAIIE